MKKNILFVLLLAGCSGPPNVEIHEYWYSTLKTQSESVSSYQKIIKETPPKYLDCYSQVSKSIVNYNSEVQRAFVDNIVTNEEYDKLSSCFEMVQTNYKVGELEKKKKEILEASETVK